MTHTPGTYLAQPASPLPFTLGGIDISVNDVPCPILAVVIPQDSSAMSQINFQVPLERNASIEMQLPGGFQGTLVVEGGGGGNVLQTSLPRAPGGGFIPTDMVM